MAYDELEQFLDTKQARILEMFTIWNFLGFVAGLGFGQVLVNLTGIGMLTPLCIVVGVVLTLRLRNMLVAVRLWLGCAFLVRRWLGQDVTTRAPMPTGTGARADQGRIVVLERIVNGEVVYGRRSTR